MQQVKVKAINITDSIVLLEKGDYKPLKSQMLKKVGEMTIKDTYVIYSSETPKKVVYEISESKWLPGTDLEGEFYIFQAA